MNPTARNAYMGQMVNTASPARLLVMLFERLALDVQKAADCQRTEQHLAAGPHLMHAQEIVLELLSSLDHDAWDGTDQLAAIYQWLYGQLIRANMTRDVAVTEDCVRIIEPLAETWREAAALSLVG